MSRELLFVGLVSARPALPIAVTGAWRPRVMVDPDALEEARDDEAVCDGAHPDDLAAAIIGAARLAGRGAGAALTGAHAIERRISRLLRSAPRERPVRSFAFTVGLAMRLATAAIVGFTIGEDLLALLPGVRR